MLVFNMRKTDLMYTSNTLRLLDISNNLANYWSCTSHEQYSPHLLTFKLCKWFADFIDSIIQLKQHLQITESVPVHNEQLTWLNIWSSPWTKPSTNSWLSVLQSLYQCQTKNAILHIVKHCGHAHEHHEVCSKQ